MFTLLLLPAMASAEEEDTTRISLWIQPGFTVLGLGVAADAYALDATPGLFRPASMAFGDEYWIPTRKGRGYSYGINANVLRLGVTF